jgi:gamma-glutamyltranspeptidase / glutathione hydrolase
MQNTSLSFLHILSIAALVAATACSGELSRPESAVTEAVPGGFVAPDGWSFPPGHVVPTYGAEGMVSTTDGVASEMGVEVLRRGGNAVDAAVAIHFALAVVNPEAGNIGGGGFMVVRMADRRTAALDFREKAPRAATRDIYLDPRGAVTDRVVVGHLAAGVPGSVAGMWEAHQRFGSRPWAELVQPAVNLAGGIVVHERLAQSLQWFEQQLQRYPTTAAAFLPDGRAPRVGDRLVQRDLAETLRLIARDGKEGFYRGRTAALVVAEMRRGGGIISHEDLGSYEAVWRDPIVFQYRQHTVVSMPPPSSGGATLAEILNILEGYDLRALSYHSRDHVHLWTEAVKRAFADRNEYLADPDFVPQPTERMTSDAYAAERRAAIQADRATPSDQVRPGMGAVRARPRAAARREGEHTTHYSVLDREGNAVAVTTTINSLYGNLVTVAGAGFLLNNEMDDFAARPGIPNQSGLVQGEANGIESQKRMVSSMTPTILLDPSERVKLITGTRGGPTIITQIAQIISNIVDFNMDMGGATVAPRLHHQHLPDVLRYERAGLRSDVESALRALGHAVEAFPGYGGDTQSILVLPDGTVTGVADPRVGGAALSVRESPYGRLSFPRPTLK